MHLPAPSENIVCIGGSRGTEVLNTEVLVLGQPAELYSLQSCLEAVCYFLLPVFSHKRKHLTNLFQNHSETLTSLFCLSNYIWNVSAMVVVVCSKKTFSKGIEIDRGNH